MSEPDDYARAVIRKALEETGVTGDLDVAADLTYRMLFGASMLHGAYWPTDYVDSILGHLSGSNDARRRTETLPLEAVDLLKYALHLRMHGERAPGGNETWAEFDHRCEDFLRRQLEDPSPETGV